MNLFIHLQNWVKQQSSNNYHTGDDYVVQRPHKKQRTYHFVPYKKKHDHITLMLMGICVILFTFGAVNLFSYAKDIFFSWQASKALQNIYYAEQPNPTATTTVFTTPPPIANNTPTFMPVATAEPRATTIPTTKLEPLKYPNNPYSIINDRFKALRRQSKDIIGWLTIDGVIDEAVVQRNNEYYLDRDYRGYHNANGAIFLDEACNLSTRPYTYLLFGHNMKSGMMFGSLRNFEDITFFRNNPFITFDTAYEDGSYVIFAVATVSTDPSNWRYVNFAMLNSSVIAHRQESINNLILQSKYYCSIDIKPQDQLLLLITCVDDDTKRRVIAARRIRENETPETLKRTIQKITLR